MRKFCQNCDDYKPNIEKLDNLNTFCAIQTAGPVYDGKPFDYCPWCGYELEKEPEYYGEDNT